MSAAEHVDAFTKAMELSIDLRRGFKAVADCFDVDKASLVFLAHIQTITSLTDEQGTVLVAALRRDYMDTRQGA